LTVAPDRPPRLEYTVGSRLSEGPRRENDVGESGESHDPPSEILHTIVHSVNIFNLLRPIQRVGRNVLKGQQNTDRWAQSVHRRHVTFTILISTYFRHKIQLLVGQQIQKPPTVAFPFAARKGGNQLVSSCFSLQPIVSAGLTGSPPFAEFRICATQL
jgi:hypothetical protein